MVKMLSRLAASLVLIVLIFSMISGAYARWSEDSSDFDMEVTFDFVALW